MLLQNNEIDFAKLYTGRLVNDGPTCNCKITKITKIERLKKFILLSSVLK